MQASDDNVVLTGAPIPAWESFLHAYAPFLALLFVVLALVPAVRQRFRLTPFATLLMTLASAAVALDLMADWAIGSDVGGSPDSLVQRAFSAFQSYGLNSYVTFGVALAIFAAAQLRTLRRAAPIPAHAIGIDAIAPATTATWRLRFTPAGIGAFFRDRRRILSDVNQSAALIEDAGFNPLSFALRGVALAGLPSTIAAAAVTAFRFIFGESEPLDADEAKSHALNFAFEILRSYTLPFGLLLATTLAAWAIVGFQSKRTRVTRQLLLTIDAARGLLPLALSTMLFNRIGLATPVELNDGLHAVFNPLFEKFTGGDDTFPSVAQRLTINGLGDASAAALFLLLWGSTIWLTAQRLYGLPATVATLAGREAAGSPVGAVLRHAFFIVVLPLLIALAIAWLEMQALR